MKKKAKFWSVIISIGLNVLLTATSVSAQSSSSKESLVLVGPVESVDSKSSFTIVLGQKVLLGTRVTPKVGTTIAIFGRVQSDGTIIASSTQSLSLYVPGADLVLLTGVVKALDPSLGQLTVGNVQIDYSAAVAGSSSEIKEGTVIQLVGTQPAPSGIVLAEQFSVATSDGIIGSGLNLNGIIGGGKVAADGIIGGGKVSADGIIGGGKIASDGIIGGGKVSADGIIGGGKVSAAGIIGGGF